MQHTVYDHMKQGMIRANTTICMEMFFMPRLLQKELTHQISDGAKDILGEKVQKRF